MLQRRTVKTAKEIRENVGTFNDEARQNTARAKRLLRETTYCVFDSNRKVFGPSNVRRAFKEVLVTAKLAPMRIHDLRHTCATLLLAQGVHPKVVQEILADSQISLTMDTHSTVLPTVSCAAAAQMDAVLRA